MYWHQCDKCGARLDPGEHCDCEEEAAKEKSRMEEIFKQEAGSGQLMFNWPPERLKA